MGRGWAVTVSWAAKTRPVKPPTTRSPCCPDAAHSTHVPPQLQLGDVPRAHVRRPHSAVAVPRHRLLLVPHVVHGNEDDRAGGHAHGAARALERPRRDAPPGRRGGRRRLLDQLERARPVLVAGAVPVRPWRQQVHRLVARAHVHRDDVHARVQQPQRPLPVRVYRLPVGLHQRPQQAAAHVGLRQAQLVPHARAHGVGGVPHGALVDARERHVRRERRARVGQLQHARALVVGAPVEVALPHLHGAAGVHHQVLVVRVVEEVAVEDGGRQLPPARRPVYKEHALVQQRVHKQVRHAHQPVGKAAAVVAHDGRLVHRLGARVHEHFGCGRRARPQQRHLLRVPRRVRAQRLQPLGGAAGHGALQQLLQRGFRGRGRRRRLRRRRLLRVRHFY
jgi:hypothetical protein